ncbi:MAG TPA: FtsX-like permease family protein [Casimicrobiaceae bacterium]|nr:FtsX-like permease family protein [Casimicrobiaceae bacterium]
MKAIDRKLLRDLWQLKSQIVTVALVVASAFSGFAGSLATYASLVAARDDFYASARFGDVFGDLKRAPRPLERRMRAIQGVDDLRTTVVFDVTLDVPGVAEPVVGRLIGLPEPGESSIDRVVIRQGRLPRDSEPTSVVLSEGFALARHLGPGRSFTAIINGTQETLHVVGIGLAPDYIFATRGGAFPDDRNFGVVWMPRRPLAAAFAMEGAFNHVSLRLSRDANPRAVVDALDRLLEPYGGTNAYGRDEQLSHRILAQEIDQWKVIGTLIPSIFLAVTAFLLNVVLSRQITTQREQIAALKAMGYDNATLVAHYLRQVGVIVALGIALGIGIGWWFGSAVTALYAEFFHFPAYRFRMPAWVLATAAAIIAIGAVGGAIGAVLKTVRLAPAEAMRPPFPGRYRPTLAERLALGRFLTPAMRMTFRTMERRPWRAVLTTTGIAAAMAIVVSGLFWRDALDYMMDVQFAIAQRADAEVALTEPMSARSLREIGRMPGVLRAEGAREIAVRLVAGHHTYRTVVSGLPADGELRRLLDQDARPVPMPPEGILLTDRLAQRLGVRPGDRIELDFLTGERRRVEVGVAGTSADLIGLTAYMRLGALTRLAGEPDTLSSFSVLVDHAHEDALFRALKSYPRIATVASKLAMLQNFHDTSARNVLFFTSVLTAFAAVIAVGVVYNNARIALQERAWELASLRVLGFTRGEVSMFLLGELAFELTLALPLGCVLGYALAWTMVRMTHSDLIAIPLVVAPRTYALAALAVVAAGIASAMIVRRRDDRLDLVGVLKTRE